MKTVRLRMIILITTALLISACGVTDNKSQNNDNTPTNQKENEDQKDHSGKAGTIDKEEDKVKSSTKSTSSDENMLPNKTKETEEDEMADTYLNDDAKVHQDDKDDPKKNQNRELSRFITHYHKLINEITAYEKHKNIDWIYMETLEKELSIEVNNLLSYEDSIPTSMKVDLERIMQLAEISLGNHDPNSVIYIHQILHDLDVEYNDYAPNNKYGFSNYDGGGENQLTVSSYIKEHKGEDG